MSKREIAEAEAKLHHWINQHTGQCVTIDQVIAAAGPVPAYVAQNITRLMLNNKTAEFCCHPDGRLVLPHTLRIIKPYKDTPTK